MLKVDYKYLAVKTNVTFSSAPVYRVSGLLNKDLRVFLKSYVKEQKIPSRPEEYKRAISSIYCIDRADHFLKLAPYEWLSLIETQVTKGLAYFLNSGNESQNRSRVQTLVSAIGIPSKVENQSVEAEFRNNDNTRIDLIIKWEDGAMRNQITIEAKLNYELRKNQLRSYLKNTKKKKRKIRQLLFLCYF
ncbi:PD-(D/E)XK nuclease family protein [uncultured Thalassospira sp.]|uniref:PD-(D/E)XK nuclease family protein n=1 Tax=uncultured Thalassospira sp. TaxID=404382 RepID=UPI0030D9487A|tara:strand:+ start:151 stop:717 length:567 start_codon:yes stop_codon:yes gene_type:complete